MLRALLGRSPQYAICTQCNIPERKLGETLASIALSSRQSTLIDIMLWLATMKQGGRLGVYGARAGIIIKHIAN